MPRPRLSPERRHTLCASLRSRNACQHYTRDSRRATLYEFTGKMPRPRLSPERGHTFGASLCSRNSFQHFTRDISQKSHFIQKFAGKMPQIGPRTRAHALCEPAQSKRMSRLFTEIYRQNASDQNHAADFVRACAVQTHVKFHKRQQKSHFIQKFTGKMPQAKTAPQTLCEPAQSTHMSRFHKSHFMRKFTGKMPQPKMSPERRRTLCASLRSRNACQDFTRATLYGNLQIKCRRPEWAPWSSTGLYTYRKNPSVWTHCLGNNYWTWLKIIEWSQLFFGIYIAVHQYFKICSANKWYQLIGSWFIFRKQLELKVRICSIIV